jgi:RNA polymerase sigma factor (sigma-70 family)
MLRGSFAPLLRQLRLVTDASDGQLLQRFAVDRDEVAFAELVRRHGPLVWKVCSQVLGHEQDAEDAFQAAFLVLACKAGAVRKQESLGSWLHGVAYRTAMKARTESARRKTREQKVAAATPLTLADGPDRDLLAILHEELQRLPAKYRLSVVVCCLEGKTRTQAARQLGWKEGTVAGRLAEAKKLLQRRLERRGVMLAAGPLAVALVEGPASAAAPATLASSTVRAALLFAAGEGAAAGVLSARVVALADKVGRALLLAKCQTGTAVVLALTLLAAGTALIARSAAPEQPQATRDERASIRADQQPAEKPAPADRYGDPLPPGAVARLGTVRFRQGSNIGSIAFAPDGKIVGTAGDDDVVRLWDLATGKELAHFGQTHTGALTDIAFSPDGKTFAAAGGYGERIYLFDRRKLAVIREIKTKEQPSFVTLVFSPDGTKLALGSAGEVRLWEVATGKEVLQLKGHQDTVPTVAFSPDGKMVACGIGNATIRLWDAVTGKELYTLPAAKRVVRYGVPVAFAPKGNLLAAAIDDKIVCLWDPATGKEVRRLPAAERLVYSTAFSPDGQFLAVGTGGPGLLAGGQVILWQVSTAKVLRQFSGFGIYAVLAFSPDGKVLATNSGSSTLHLWDTATGKELFSDRGHQDAVQSLAFAADSRRVVTSNWAEKALIWDATTGKEIGQYPGKRPWLSPDGKTLVTFTGLGEITVHLLDVPSHQEQRQFQLPKGNYLIAISPDGKTLACGDGERWIGLWDVTQGKELRRLDCPLRWVQRNVFSPNGSVFSANGRILALAGVDQGQEQTWLWDVANGKVLRKLAGSSCCPAFSPDGKLIAGGARDATLRLWDAATGKELHAWQMVLGPPADSQFPMLAGKEQDLMAVCFSSDGRMLATGNRINQVRVWEVATGHNRLLLDGQRGWPCLVTALAFSPDGKLLVSGSQDTTALVWDLCGDTTARAEDLSGQPKRPRLEEAALRSLWQQLADTDAAQAYQAVCTLTAAPADSVPFLQLHLKPPATIPANQIAQWIANLDSPHFAVRKQATEELEKAIDLADSSLRQALQGNPALEQRQRLEQLLAKLEPRNSPERLRILRAVEVLEHIGTQEAMQVLSTVAKGPSEALLTREGKASLDRLAHRFAAGQP